MNEVFWRWREITAFRQNPQEANEKFGQLDLFHQRTKTKNDWYAILHRLFAQRWFLGYMSRQEVIAQEKFLAECHIDRVFFVFLDKSANIILSRSCVNVLDMVVCWRTRYPDNEVAKRVIDDIEQNKLPECRYPLDRGKALIYRVEVNRRARIGADTWTLVATRAGIPKDIRLLVAKIIWDGRHEWMG